MGSFSQAGRRDAENERSSINISLHRFQGSVSQLAYDELAVEEPLEIQLGYTGDGSRQVKSISVTMRTPGNDFELAAGFLMTEGVVRDANDIDHIEYVLPNTIDTTGLRTQTTPSDRSSQEVLPYRPERNMVRVDLFPEVEVSLANLQRNFYTTSSCGICGKASLLALQTVCPPRRKNDFTIDSQVLYQLQQRFRAAQGVFDKTGGLHGAGLFDASGTLYAIREDVGRHNAVDKLIGSEFLADRTPLSDRLLLLSGRASFELLQKALMGGVSLVAAVGAPSSLAVQVAKQFDITLIGFLREAHFNVYHGVERVQGYPTAAQEKADEVKD
jgi:FdhD protein